MDKLDRIKEASVAASKEFRARVESSGLEIAMDNGSSVLITGYGNKGQDIPARLDNAGLEWQPTGAGAYTASAFPFVKRALNTAL